jgi:ketosteroid isomerase-like protein
MSRTSVSRFWIALSVACLVVAVAAAQDMRSDSGQNATEQQLRSAHQQMFEAAVKSDKDAVSRYVADDLTWVNANGQITGKEQLLASLPPPVDSVEVKQVQLYGNVAIVTGVSHYKDGREGRFLQQWVSTDGQWKVRAHQGAVAAPAGAASQATGTSGTTMKGEAREPARRTVAPTLRTADERSIWKVQTDLLRTYLKGDTAAYSKLTADNYVRLSPEGTQNKEEWLQVVAKNRDKSAGDLAMYDVQISVNGDTACLTQELSGKDPGGEMVAPTRFTRIFVKKNGQWQQAAVALTPIKEQ